MERIQLITILKKYRKTRGVTIKKMNPSLIKGFNTMKIHEANTDIDNAFWMKQNYDLAQKA